VVLAAAADVALDQHCQQHAATKNYVDTALTCMILQSQMYLWVILVVKLQQYHYLSRYNRQY
jgi:hypothetical protein